ncbi:MAG TPA: tripartite tricarboxylate transporter substrate binding protein [Hyphomicrobiaceae bacterium]|nr:tripartite tricarboxylate transporter substrate binding protein [Hyphomicrobiaceae bacterium]
MHRRGFLVGTAGAVLAAPAIVRAQVKWPERPVKLVVPFAPGGSTDSVTRPWAEKLTEAFGQQFVIENRGGASGMIGAEAVAKAPADGYTYLVGTSTPVVSLPLLRKVSYDAKAFVPVGRVGDAITGFAIHPSVGAKTFAEMVDYAKKNPGKLAFGSSGMGTAPHLRFELMKMATGVDILHVPYRGGADTLNDLLAGAIQMMNESSSIPHVKAGKLILLNINHHQRVRTFPDVPTLTELGYPGIDGGSWFGVYGLKTIPAEILERFNAKLVEIGKTPEMHARLEAVSAVLTPQTLPEIAQHLAEDSQVTERIIRTANIKME